MTLADGFHEGWQGDSLASIRGGTGKELREPVVYGRFWYEDVWKKPHYHSFILTLAPRSLPANISPAYTEWT
jgi:hypothetical protein